MIDRRAFLTGVIAAALVPAWEEVRPDLGSEQAIDDAWDYLLDDPVAFFVEPGGTLGLGLEPESPPQTRSEAFDVPQSELASPSRLGDAANLVAPIRWEIQSALEDLRDEFLVDGENWQTGRRRWCETSGRPEADYPSELVIQALRELPEDVEVADWGNFLQTLPEDLFARLRARLAEWLDQEPSWTGEEEYFASWFRQQDSALEYFNDLGVSRNVLKELGVKIVEGEHPGSTYYAAELRLPLEEANRRARQLGIPVLFVEVEEA